MVYDAPKLDLQNPRRRPLAIGSEGNLACDSVKSCAARVGREGYIVQAAGSFDGL
jgi:hypothetical protein